MFAPPCSLPDGLRKRFSRRVRRAERRWAREHGRRPGRDVHAIVQRHGVMPLLADASGLLALCEDGTVVEVSWRSPERATPVADVRTRDLALIHGARYETDLCALRPTRREGDPDCPRCRGTNVFEPSMPAVRCFCAGLGFLPAGWQEDEEEEVAPPRTAVARRALVAVGPTGEVEVRALPSSEAARPPASEPHAGGALRDQGADLVAARPRRRALWILLGVALALAGGLAGAALAAGLHLGSLSFALACAVGLLPGVLLVVWSSVR